MKKVLSNSYCKTYFVLLCSLFVVEILFRMISDSPILDVATLRIFLGINIFTAVMTFILNFFNRIGKIIGISIIVLGVSLYSWAQAGFLNFIGVYMSFQTSSQLVAVTDYIMDFILSFEPIYYITLVPFVVVLVILIISRKKIAEGLKFKKALLATTLILTVSVSFYAVTIVHEKFQNSLQSVSNKELFLTASNPSLVIQNYGSLGFLFLDVKAMLFPVTIKETYVIEQEVKTDVNEYTRLIDDTYWKELIENDGDNKYSSLHNYFINQSISDKNEYTGMFKDKNLIIIMMESVNDIMLDPDYYPNFNKLVSEGWYWENNYSPRNSCATMNNEFSGMTGLYSIYNTCTASTYKKNTYATSIFNLFNKEENYVTFSAHNYTQAYYPRKTIHANMGSGEYYGVEKLGIPYSNQYINWSNDDDFLEVMLEIIDKKTSNGENFMTWLTTVSAHQPFTVNSEQGNAYYDMTRKTKYPTEIRRYMSKLKLLDLGLGILLEGLESRGILDDTVIVLFGDHYPYGISTSKLNKVLPYDTKEDLNAERVPFVIYNSQMESQVFSDYTTYINIVPTLANLFDLEYDPRLYVGEDLLSEDYESLVVFADGSWKNEFAFYNATKSKIKYYTSNEYTEEDIKRINDLIETKVKISSEVIKKNYFSYLDEEVKKIEKEYEILAQSTCAVEDKNIKE